MIYKFPLAVLKNVPGTTKHCRNVKATSLRDKTPISRRKNIYSTKLKYQLAKNQSNKNPTRKIILKNFEFNTGIEDQNGGRIFKLHRLEKTMRNLDTSNL